MIIMKKSFPEFSEHEEEHTFLMLEKQKLVITI